jgi:hypothetical protein
MTKHFHTTSSHMDEKALKSIFAGGVKPLSPNTDFMAGIGLELNTNLAPAPEMAANAAGGPMQSMGDTRQLGANLGGPAGPTGMN